MACPKKKTSHQKQHSRRANWKAELSVVGACNNCGVPAKPHQICIVCGYYRGRPARRKNNLV